MTTALQVAGILWAIGAVGWLIFTGIYYVTERDSAAYQAQNGLDNSDELRRAARAVLLTPIWPVALIRAVWRDAGWGTP